MSKNLMAECFRWYGEQDEVSLAYIRQAGCVGVYTALHSIPYGEAWSLEAIRERKTMIEAAGMKWVAVESVPVHEDIKTRTGDYERHIENYRTTLKNLGEAGLTTVIYNFMPVLDWVRTDLKHKLEDGSECLKFDPVNFAVFELYLLQRTGAETDYTDAQKAEAKLRWDKMDENERKAFERAIVDVFPGCKLGLSMDEVRSMLARYGNIDRAKLKEHLKLFLEAILPVAEEYGIRMAIHPDDPPRSILGLPRIVSTEQDIKDLLTAVPSISNGICFCTGSLSPLPNNDLVRIVRRYGDHIHAVHLRSTERHPDGSFHEARHLEGSVDMYAVVMSLLLEQACRIRNEDPHWQLSFRPDHGHTIMDDLRKPDVSNPGYSCLGRMRGLAELRGLQFGLSRIVPTEFAK